MSQGWSIFLGIATIVAVLVGPLFALWAQSMLEQRRQKLNRKLGIFRTLMSQRATMLSAPFVEALNSIEVEFYGQREVIDAWKVFLDQVGKPQETDPTLWNHRRIETMTDLLEKMALSLNYEFDRVSIQRNTYYPIGHGKMEDDWTTIRQELAAILSAKKPFPVFAMLPNQPISVKVAQDTSDARLAPALPIQPVDVKSSS